MNTTGAPVSMNNVWLREIGQTLDRERYRSYQALRAVLHSLCDRLTIDNASHLGDQLPVLAHRIYYEARDIRAPWRQLGAHAALSSRRGPGALQA